MYRLPRWKWRPPRPAPPAAGPSHRPVPAQAPVQVPIPAPARPRARNLNRNLNRRFRFRLRLVRGLVLRLLRRFPLEDVELLLRRGLRGRHHLPRLQIEQEPGKVRLPGRLGQERGGLGIPSQQHTQPQTQRQRHHGDSRPAAVSLVHGASLPGIFYAAAPRKMPPPALAKGKSLGYNQQDPGFFGEFFYGITAQLCLRPSPNLLPHPCSYKRGKYIQYSRPFITFV